LTPEPSYTQSQAPGEPDFSRLVELYYAQLYRFAVSLTRTESDAADLVQETFAIWAEKGAQLKDPGKVKSWLFTTLNRCFLQEKRHATKFPEVEISAAEDELPSVSPDLVNRIDAQKIVELLGRVDPRFRAAVALFYLEDYSYEEIGGIIGIPLGTVKSRIARGIAELKLLVSRTGIAGGGNRT
jgi:RNA polymerase sigma-70 factor (ECF subfamily)